MGATFGLEPVRKPAEFGAAVLERHKGTRHRLGRIVRLPIVRGGDLGKIVRDLAIEARDLIRNRLAPQDLLAAGDSPELRAIQSNEPGLEKPAIPAQHDERTARANDRW